MTVMLDERFMKQIDLLAAKRGLQAADDYLAQWKWSEEEEREGSAQRSRGGIESRTRSEGLVGTLVDTEWPSRSPSTDNRLEATSGLSLFDQAEAMGIDVPTSCRKQGKCKECMVEVVEGMNALSPHDRAGAASEGKLPAFVPDICDRRETGHRSLPHHAPRTHAHRAAGVWTACAAIRQFELDPAVTRDGDRILIDGVEVERSTGPIHGIAMDLGTTTVVLRLDRSRNRRADCGHFV